MKLVTARLRSLTDTKLRSQGARPVGRVARTPRGLLVKLILSDELAARLKG